MITTTRDTISKDGKTSEEVWTGRVKKESRSISLMFLTSNNAELQCAESDRPEQCPASADSKISLNGMWLPRA
jgi:hypothetical protein